MPAAVISLVTTEPAPITTSSTIRTGMMVALEPMETRLPTSVARHSSLRPRAGPPVENVIIDEHHAMTDKAVFADRHQFADEGMGLHPGARADHHAFLDFRKRPDKAVIADPAAVNVARLDDLDPRAEFDVAHAGLMHVGLVHDATPSRLSRGVKRSETS